MDETPFCLMLFTFSPLDRHFSSWCWPCWLLHCAIGPGLTAWLVVNSSQACFAFLPDLVVGSLLPCFLWECRGGVGLAHPFLSLVCVPYDVRPPGVASRLPLGPHISMSCVRPPSLVRLGAHGYWVHSLAYFVRGLDLFYAFGG